MLSLVLRLNNFDFNGQHYLQIQGVAIGTRAAPTIANLVMGDFETKHIYIYPSQPVLWIRFIDDNFMIWTHGHASLDIFIQHLNKSHPTLKFTFEAFESSVSFLDTLIQFQQRKLYTKLYNKPTDSHSYLYLILSPSSSKDRRTLQPTTQSQTHMCT